jgi:hypothetical protein
MKEEHKEDSLRGSGKPDAVVVFQPAIVVRDLDDIRRRKVNLNLPLSRLDSNPIR